jgi:hypothetical protein
MAAFEPQPQQQAIVPEANEGVMADQFEDPKRCIAAPATAIEVVPEATHCTNAGWKLPTLMRRKIFSPATHGFVLTFPACRRHVQRPSGITSHCRASVSVHWICTRRPPDGNCEHQYSPKGTILFPCASLHQQSRHGLGHRPFLLLGVRNRSKRHFGAASEIHFRFELRQSDAHSVCLLLRVFYFFHSVRKTRRRHRIQKNHGHWSLHHGRRSAAVYPSGQRRLVSTFSCSAYDPRCRHHRLAGSC